MKSNVFLEGYRESELIPQAMDFLLSKFGSPKSEIFFTSSYESCNDVINLAQKVEDTIIFTGAMVGPWGLPPIDGYNRRHDIENYICSCSPVSSNFNNLYVPFIYVNKEKRNVVFSKKLFTKYGKIDFTSFTYSPIAVTQTIPTLTPWLFPEYEQVKNFVLNNPNYAKECNNL